MRQEINAAWLIMGVIVSCGSLRRFGEKAELNDRLLRNSKMKFKIG